jgi:hypothetical protein
MATWLVQHQVVKRSVNAEFKGAWKKATATTVVTGICPTGLKKIVNKSYHPPIWLK